MSRSTAGEPARDVHPTVILAVLAVGIIPFGLLQSFVVPVLATVRTELNGSPAAGSWILSAYLLSAAIATPVLGRLGDILGKRRILVATLFALAVGSLLAAVAPSMGVMILGRVVQGLGGGMLPVAFGIIRDEFPAPRITSGVGSIAAIVAVGAGAGTVLAGPIVNLLGWRWIFWFPLILTTAAAIAAMILIPESPVRHRAKVTWSNVVLLAGWLVALLLGLSQGSAWGWTSLAEIGALATAIVLGVAWALAELRTASPLIDVRLMSSRAVWTNNTVALLLGVAMFGTFAALPQFLQTSPGQGYGFGASGSQAGLMLLPMPVAMFTASLVSGSAATRAGGRALVISGCAISSLGMLILALARSEEWEVYAATAVLGTGIGLAFASMSALLVAAVPDHHTGAATGMNTNLRTIGGSIGTAIATGILTSLTDLHGTPKMSSYTTAFIALAACLFFAALTASLIPQRGNSIVESTRMV